MTPRKRRYINGFYLLVFGAVLWSGWHLWRALFQLISRLFD